MLKNHVTVKNRRINIMKRFFLFLIIFTVTVFSLSSCKSSELKKSEPVTLTMWHVYGEQAYSPMDRLVDEFNETVGYEKGIIIDVTALSNATDIGDKLLAAQEGKPGALAMPDLFFAHASNARALGTESLIDWSELFSEKQLSAYVPGFLDEGTIDGKLCVFPTSKSTYTLYIAGEQFERFSEATGITYDNLADWDGFFDAAAMYYEWSGGKPFCAFDYMLRNVELYAQASSTENLFLASGEYDFSNADFKSAFDRFTGAVANGYIIVSDLYANTQIMTGEVMCGIESSAAILYFNDNVTYADGTTEPTNLKVLPMPQVKGKKALMPISGVGLCATKTTSQKAEAAAIFAEWFTDPERNLDFVCETGYMPTTNGAFEKIDGYNFGSTEYKELYTAIKNMKENCTSASSSATAKYYKTLNDFYDYLRQNQSDIHKRLTDGESADNISAELWAKLQSK